jgi:two-component system cell cycle sensor histidine kinase/response regulator CckA
METILLVEDDPSNLMVISSILRLDGYNVVETDRGTAAACVCRKLQPDLLVSDIALPDLSGTEVASQAVECFPEMPVLFISGTPVDGWSAADQSNFKRLSAKVVGFLEKPFLPAALRQKVRDLLNRLPHA